MKKTNRFSKLVPALALIGLFCLGLLFPVKAWAYVRISSSTFPDKNFMNYVKQFDTNGDGSLSDPELAKVKTIDLEKQSVKDLMGIAFFSELEELNCRNNSLTELNVGGLTNLKVLKCSVNNLTELNVSGCQALERLDCDWNKLTKLTITGLSNLDHLNCSTNELTELSVSGCSKLTRLDAHYNKLKTLDLSASSKLTDVDVSENRLTSLNLTKNTELQHLDCTDNKLSSLDLTKNTKLTYLGLNQNSLTELDLHANKDLENLDVYYCQLTELDLSANTKLAYLNCRMNDLAKVDISNCEKLMEAVEDGSFQEYKNELRDYDYYAITDSNCSVLASVEADAATAVRKPIVLEQPENQTVSLGKKATFTVNVKGGGLRYQWVYSKDHGEYWNDVITNGNSAVYSLTAAERHDGYRYVCAVTNDCGTTWSSSVMLSVAPKITAQPKDMLGGVGKIITFTITATGAGSCQWQVSKDNWTTWKDLTAASARTAAYKLSVKESHDGYQYRCLLYSPVTETRTISKAATLTVVTEKPVISTQPMGKTAAIGDKVTFKVKASGLGLSCQWWYRTSSTGTWTKVSAASGKTSDYSFTAAAKHNGYQYKCVVTNPAGKTTSKIVTLKVKPKITTQPVSKTVSSGRKVSFTVTARNATKYQWYYRTSRAGSWKIISGAAAKKAAYTFTANKARNGYQYQCKVSNATSYVYTNAVTLKVK
jgi:Leucine-rich repeat (LRR) protein